MKIKGQQKGKLQIGKPPAKLKIDKSKPLGKEIKDEGKGKLQIGKPPAKFNIDKSKPLGKVIKVDSVKNGILTTKQYGEIKDLSGEEIYNNLKSNATPIFMPWTSFIPSILMTMTYILKNNSNDCSVPKETIVAFDKPPKTTKTSAQNPNRQLIENLEEVAKSIIRCWMRSKVVAIPLHVSQSGGGRDSHHQNLILFNTWRMEAEHFEPHGEKFYGRRNNKGELKKLQGINMSTGIKKLNKEIDKQVKSIMNVDTPQTQKERLKELQQGFKYLPPDETCPTDFQGYKGFQSRDRSSAGDRRYEGVLITEIGGYCTMYSLFYMDLRLKTLRSPAKEVVRSILGLFKKDYDPNREEFRKNINERYFVDGITNYSQLSAEQKRNYNEEDRIFRMNAKQKQESFLNLMRGMAKFSFEEQSKMVDKGLISKQDLIKSLGTKAPVGTQAYTNYKNAVETYLMDDWIKFTT